MASTGRKSAIGATALALVGTATPVNSGVTIKAAAGNAGIVYVGSSTITANTTDATDGFQLSAGEAVTLPRDFATDAANIYVIASTTSQVVFFVIL